jgi:hypothetical protein
MAYAGALVSLHQAQFSRSTWQEFDYCHDRVEGGVGILTTVIRYPGFLSLNVYVFAYGFTPLEMETNGNKRLGIVTGAYN